MADLHSFIDDLSEDLQAQGRLAHPLVRFLPWIGGTLLYIALATYISGARDDWALKITDQIFLFEIIMAAFIGLSAGIVSLFLSVPDMRGQQWLKAVPLSFLVVLVSWITTRTFLEESTDIQLSWYECIYDAFIMGFIPIVFLTLISRRGATTQPHWQGFMNILAVSSLAWIGLRFVCPFDDVGHAFLYHFTPFIVIGAILGYFSKRIFNW